MNSMDYQNIRFARRAGETWLRPDYANAIEHYRPHDGQFMRTWPLIIFVILILICAGLLGTQFQSFMVN